MYNVVFPCVIMSALTLLVFCLPPDSGEKVTMGITVLLSFSVFLLRMGEDLPETSEFIPLLSKSRLSSSLQIYSMSGNQRQFRRQERYSSKFNRFNLFDFI